MRLTQIHLTQNHTAMYIVGILCVNR